MYKYILYIYIYMYIIYIYKYIYIYIYIYKFISVLTGNIPSPVYSGYFCTTPDTKLTRGVVASAGRTTTSSVRPAEPSIAPW